MMKSGFKDMAWFERDVRTDVLSFVSAHEIKRKEGWAAAWQGMMQRSKKRTTEPTRIA
jgi:hypothetical protein